MTQTVSHIPAGPPGYCGSVADELRRIAAARDAELAKLRARVAELEAQQVGLAYSREPDEVDNPTPVSPARGGAPHVVAMVDGGELVDETPDPDSACAEHDDAHLGETCPDIVAKLADEARDEPVHYRFGMNVTTCGLKPGEVLKASANWAAVTCKACIDEMPF